MVDLNRIKVVADDSINAFALPGGSMFIYTGLIKAAENMARFFEKLEADGAKQSRVAEFFSSHPNPGNRVKSVEALVAQLPAKQYTNGDQAAFSQAQKTVQKLHPPKPRAKPEPRPQQ